MKIQTYLSPVAAAAAALCSLCVHAQQASPPAQGAKEETQSVVISAQKRLQSAVDVPMSVTSLNAQAIDNAKIDNLYNLVAVVPGLMITAVDPPGQGTSMQMRGLGNSVFNMGFDPAVGTFVDGISRSRAGLLAASDLFDLERIEVLKGPQGTVFGKNTTAGMVHMISKRPGFKGLDGEASLTYESYNTWRTKFASNINVSDELALRVAATKAKGDGWMTVVPSGQKIHGANRDAVKLSALWKPTKDFEALLVVDRSNLDEVCCVPMRLVNDPKTVSSNLDLAKAVGSTIVSPANIGALQVESNLPPAFKARDGGVMLNLSWNLGGATLTSITGQRRYSDSNVKDNDFSGVDMLRSNDSLPKVDLTSQEFHLSGSSADKTTDWLVGVYASRDTIERENDFIWGPQVPNLIGFIKPGTAFIHRFKQQIDSKAVFGNVSFQLAPKWSTSIGARWSQDEKHGTLASQYPVSNALGLPNSLPLAVVHDYDSKLSQSAPTYNLSLQYKPEKGTMAYGTLARGYKSGGISMTRDAAGQKMFFMAPGATTCPAGTKALGGPLCGADPSSPNFGQETADHAEVGLKTELLNRTVLLNTALWHTKFTGLQLQTLRSDGSFAVINAKGATSQGIEADMTAVVSPALRLTASVQLADTKFADGMPALSSGPGFLPFGGQQLAFSSRVTTGLGFTYNQPLTGDWLLNLSGNANYRSKYYNFSEPNVDRVQPGYALFTLRAGIRNDKWDVSVWCRNCSDQRIANSNFQIPFDGKILGHSTRWAHIAEPRVMGVTLGYNFD